MSEHVMLYIWTDGNVGPESYRHEAGYWVGIVSEATTMVVA